MVLESISDPDVGICLTYKECLSIWPYNSMAHNEDTMSCVCMGEWLWYFTSDRIQST